MNTGQAAGQTSGKPLRLWPGVVIVVLQWLARFGVPVFVPDAMAIGVMGGLLGGLAIVVWWAFFSRAPHFERWGALVLMAGGLFATSRIVHESIATGMMGMMLFVYAVPVLSLALVAWAVATRGLTDGPRRATMVMTILLACGVWTLFQTGGFTGDGDSDFSWRWAQTAEQRLLADSGEEVMAGSSQAALGTGAEWPGFRGPDRSGILHGSRIDPDWSSSPPVELWRRAIGPGWSSFAVRGSVLYTQEQRGDDEVVSAYDLETGDPIWRHSDATRFWESNAGAGPRGTPTLSGSRVYTLGATGVLNVLGADDGKVVWSRNVVTDTEMEIPTWGISGSPQVVDDLVIVAVSGTLAAYGMDTGDPRWYGPEGGVSYSSPHRMTRDGETQILLLSGSGLISVAPSDGKLLWEHEWSGYPIVQPALTDDGDLLISVTDTSGLRRLSVKHEAQGWIAEERWTSIRLKPYFNDFVVHKDHAFGFDGRILACVDLADGERKWKGGRYGNGQLILLADQDLILVLSEQGELALVRATHEQFTELARFPAIEGKTWNHPVLVGDTLLVRNGQEMAAFRLPLANQDQVSIRHP